MGTANQQVIDILLTRIDDIAQDDVVWPKLQELYWAVFEKVKQRIMTKGDKNDAKL